MYPQSLCSSLLHISTQEDTILIRSQACHTRASKMSQKPVPIILIGKGEDIGRGVIQALMPDYEGDKNPLATHSPIPQLGSPSSSPAPH